jgi:N-acetylmuramoyl-L-alanine amidase
VRRVQRALRQRGFEVPVNGVFDAATQEALLRFQRQAGLAPTSLPDLATLNRLGLDARSLYRDGPPPAEAPAAN